MRDDLKALCDAMADEYGQGPMEMRHEIEGLVRWGRITPDEAEEWLREWPHEIREAPFSEEPDPAKFDPRAAAYWTLGMAAAWILWGTDDAVREEWEKFISGRWRWYRVNARNAYEKAPGGFFKINGYELRQSEPRGAWGVLGFARANPDGLRLAPDVAERQLVNALQRGRLAAICGGEAHVRPVPVLEWAMLSPFTPGRRALHDAVYVKGDPNNPQFFNVKVSSDVVVDLWPAPEPIAAESLVEADLDGAEAVEIEAVGDELAEVASEPMRQGRISDAELHAFLETLPITPRMMRAEVIKAVRDRFGDQAPGERRIKQAYGKYYRAALRPGDKPTSNVSGK